MPEPLLLIVGGDSDPNTQRMVDQTHLRNLPYFFWNTDRDDANRIAWDFDSPGLDLGDDSIQPSAIYLRYNVFDGEASRNIAAFDMVQAYALAWPDVAILNRESMTDANNKSKNLRMAREVGFRIPDTIVMGDLTPLARIPDPANRAMKPLGGGAHTVSVDDIYQDVNSLSGLGPQFVQTKLLGENLRVFSIGGHLSCFHLKTDRLDYREDSDVGVYQVAMPTELIDATNALARRIKMDYCALDFRCEHGMQNPIFLEVNSFPMFVRFDDAGKNCLSDAILDFLI